MLLSARLIIICLAFVTPMTAAAQALPTRVNIDLLYVTSTNSTLDQHVREWASALNEKLQVLAFDTSFGLSAAGHIQVSPAPQPISPTADTLQLRWRNRNAIQIVSGHGRRSPTASAFEGNIFLGDLHGRLPILLPIDQDINGGSFERASNFVFVVTLYALSVDASARPAVSCRLLSRASTLAASLPATLISVGVVRAGIRADLAGRCGGRPA